MSETASAGASTSAPPNIAPDPSAEVSGAQELSEPVLEPKEITEHEVGEYREQDRFLPVRMHSYSSLLRLSEKER